MAGRARSSRVARPLDHRQLKAPLGIVSSGVALLLRSGEIEPWL